MRTQSSKRITIERVRNLSIQALLCFMLVFVQGASLIHSHDGDLQNQIDCDICLKVGSIEGVLTSSGKGLDYNSGSISYNSAPVAIQYAAVVPSKSRSPPPPLV